jgi:hypothetical protein
MVRDMASRRRQLFLASSLRYPSDREIAFEAAHDLTEPSNVILYLMDTEGRMMEIARQSINTSFAPS